MASQIVERNRLDHILPRSYLEGFADLSERGRLFAFDIQKQTWLPEPVSPANVGAERGYYDYSPDALPDTTADEAFKELENNFPNIRRQLVASDFQRWTRHRDFLVRYGMMLRARSRLFRSEFVASAKAAAFLCLEQAIASELSTAKVGELETAYRYSALFKNMSITRMREEIKKGVGAFAGWYWSMRFTREIVHPFITADNAVVLVGFGTSSREDAILHPDSLLFFPLCWQACLVARKIPFDRETEELAPPSVVADTYEPYLRDTQSRFAYSPARLG